MSDLMNCTPNLNARTPGQLLSLTSHLSFGSGGPLGIGGAGSLKGSLGSNLSMGSPMGMDPSENLLQTLEESSGFIIKYLILIIHMVFSPFFVIGLLISTDFISVSAKRGINSLFKNSIVNEFISRESINTSRMSGIMPFQSAESMSLDHTPNIHSQLVSSSSVCLLIISFLLLQKYDFGMLCIMCGM